MKKSEVAARVKIDQMLKNAGWRFFDSDEGNANIKLEDRVSLKKIEVDDFGNDYEKISNGFMDYLLLGNDGKPLIVVEAKKSSINPLEAQSQAKEYAKNKGVDYVILTNGEIHYFWNLKLDEIKTISSFPESGKFIDFKKNEESLQDRKKKLIEYNYDKYLIAESQDLNVSKENKKEYCEKRDNLLVLRDYQREALDKLMDSIKKGKEKFLFEMATGTGKTLVAASVIKMFLKSGFTNRVLFLVDRIDLEQQAVSDFKEYFIGDGTIQIGTYKENRDDWKNKDILVTTIQSIVKEDRYKKIFSEWDFGLIITDEAHRSISGGTNRELFKYFEGFKLGLTATPRSFLKNIDQVKLNLHKPLELEERRERDTYSIFGCEGGEPTFRYDLKRGINDGILNGAKLIDDRTIITTSLLSKKGLTFTNVDEEGNEIKDTFFMKHFERRFFSEKTNRQICLDFLNNAKRDPITQEIGKTIFFCVSQEHALKITRMLNKLASEKFGYPAGYEFAQRITSYESEGNKNSKKFTHTQNRLNGISKKVPEGLNYKTSKTRVCVTVSMMSTGYNCKDLLNVVMFRPIYSPAEFIQIKGRGTRLYDFVLRDKNNQIIGNPIKKDSFYLFDYFGICEYFEKEHNFEKPEKLIKPSNAVRESREKKYNLEVMSNEDDEIVSRFMKEVGAEGFIVDQKGFSNAVSKNNEFDDIVRLYENNEKDKAEKVVSKVFNKINFDKSRLRKMFRIKRIPTVKDIYSIIKTGKVEDDDEYFEEKFEEFNSRIHFDEKKLEDIKEFFKLYCYDPDFRKNVDLDNRSKLNPSLLGIVRSVEKYKKQVVDYILENNLYLE